MERKDELEAQVRKTSLRERLDECRTRIGKMCSEGRPPRMCIPVQWDDDDFYISTTLADAQRALDAEREKVKDLDRMYRFSIAERNKLNAETDELALEIDSRDSQLATLQAQLARWKEALGEWGGLGGCGYEGRKYDPPRPTEEQS